MAVPYPARHYIYVFAAIFHDLFVLRDSLVGKERTERRGAEDDRDIILFFVRRQGVHIWNMELHTGYVIGKEKDEDKNNFWSLVFRNKYARV